MAKFDKTFPTLDCAACILTPKMSAVGTHPNITLWSYSEVTKVDGYVGNFTRDGQTQAALRQRGPLHRLPGVHLQACVYKEPSSPDEFNEGLGKRKPIYIPFPQATPAGGPDRPGGLPQLQARAHRQVQEDLRRGLRREEGH